MRTRSLLLVVVVAGLCWMGLHRGGQAQLNSTKSPEESRIALRVDDFLNAVAEDRVEAAVDNLLKASPLLKDTKRVSRLKESIGQELPKYGNFVDAEPIKLEKVGRSLIRSTALYRGTDYPVVWHFTFYRPLDDGEWTLVALQFNVDYEKL